MRIPGHTVQGYQLDSFEKDLSGLHLHENLPPPSERWLRPGQVMVQIRAVSLNARDLQIATGTYPAPVLPPLGLIPCSDAAGEVIAVGLPAVLTDSAADRKEPKWRIGDRVATVFSQKCTHGEMGNEAQDSALGGGVDGVLVQYKVVHEDGLVRIPDDMSFASAACLPCAGVTAYHCLYGFAPRQLRAGDNVLIEGTGGVSIAALQLALAANARPIVISSSDEKLAWCVKELGVAEGDVINYEKVPQWQTKVMEITQKQGIHHTIEIGGKDTLSKALMCAAPYGCISVVGYLDDYNESSQEGQQQAPDFAKLVLYSQAIVRGVMVGSRTHFEEYLRLHVHDATLAATGRGPRLPAGGVLKPVVDKIYPWARAKEAFELLRSTTAIGKIVIHVSDEESDERERKRARYW